MGEKVTILGAGNGGHALAFDLTRRGFSVLLYQHEEYREALDGILENGGITAVETSAFESHTFKAALSGKESLAKVTSDMKEAVSFSNTLIMIVPAFAQKILFEKAMPHLREGQVLITMPGNFASLEFHQMMKKAGKSEKVFFADTDIIPYACRREGKGEVFISGVKKGMHVGVFPGEETEFVLEKIQPFFTLKLHPVEGVLAAGFSNLNMVVHPCITTLNAGWIEEKHGEFAFYREGASKRVCRVMESIDKERLDVSKAFSWDLFSFNITYSRYYGGEAKDPFHAVHESPYHAYFSAPENLDNRYLTEDIPYLMLPLIECAALGDVKIPTIESVAHLGAILSKRESSPSPRGLNEMGLKGKTIEEIKAFIHSGK